MLKCINDLEVPEPVTREWLRGIVSSAHNLNRKFWHIKIDAPVNADGLIELGSIVTYTITKKIKPH